MKDDMLLVDEIFTSIQGESTTAGQPTVFVRLFGCNVKCSYCDQPQKDFKRISATSLLEKIHKNARRVKNICFTGGEPMKQADNLLSILITLASEGYNVSIETNGCVPLDDLDYDSHRKFKYVMDVKCPSSGVADKNIYENMQVLHSTDEVKFVIRDKADYTFAKRVLYDYPTKAKILFSPMFRPDGTMFESARPLINNVIEDFNTKDVDVSISVQIHKFLEVK